MFQNTKVGTLLTLNVEEAKKVFDQKRKKDMRFRQKNWPH